MIPSIYWQCSLDLGIALCGGVLGYLFAVKRQRHRLRKPASPTSDLCSTPSKHLDLLSDRIVDLVAQSEEVRAQVLTNKHEIVEGTKALYEFLFVWKSLRDGVGELQRQIETCVADMRAMRAEVVPVTKLREAEEKLASERRVRTIAAGTDMVRARNLVESAPVVSLIEKDENEARSGIEEERSLLEKCCSRLMARLDEEGNTSQLAETDGLRSWLASEFPRIKLSVVKERSSRWFLSVLHISTGEGIAVPALDTPLGVSSELERWFEFDIKEYDTSSRLRAKDIVILPQVTSKAAFESDNRAWILKQKGRLKSSSPNRPTGSSNLLALVLMMALCVLSTQVLAGEPLDSPVFVPNQLIGDATNATVYVDISGSMRGFVSRDNAESSVHSKFLDRLKPLLVASGVVTFQAAPLAGEVSPSRPVGSFEEFKNASMYIGGETNIAGAIAQATVSPQNSLMLLLTDGVVSLSKTREAQTGARSARDCGKGSDVTCAALSVRDYVAARHGFWIVGMRFPFYGPYYVEQGGIHLRTGSVIKEHSFPRRPFYAWVGSPSQEQGRQFVGSLIEFARTEGLEYFAAEIAPGDWVGPSIAEPLLSRDVSPTDPSFCPSVDLLGNSLGSTSDSPPRISAHVQPSSIFHPREAVPALGFSVPFKPAFGGQPNGLLSLFTYRASIASIEPGVDISDRTTASSGTTETKVTSKRPTRPRLEICLRYSNPLASDRHGKSIHLLTRWYQQADGDFWEPWSTGTDDSVEATSKTLNLDEFFRILRECFSLKDSKRPTEVPLVTILYQ